MNRRDFLQLSGAALLGGTPSIKLDETFPSPGQALSDDELSRLVTYVALQDEWKRLEEELTIRIHRLMADHQAELEVIERARAEQVLTAVHDELVAALENMA